MADKESRRTKNKLNISLKFPRSKKSQAQNTAGVVEQRGLLYPSTPSSSDKKLQPEVSEISVPAPAEHRTGSKRSPAKHSHTNGDRGRTELRYKASVVKLESVLRARKLSWKTFEVPKLEVSQEDVIPQLQEQIKKMLDIRQQPGGNNDLWSKVKVMIERTFTALSPLAKNLLIVANGASSVRPLFQNFVADNKIDTRSRPFWTILQWTLCFDNGFPCLWSPIDIRLLIRR